MSNKYEMSAIEKTQTDLSNETSKSGEVNTRVISSNTFEDTVRKHCWDNPKVRGILIGIMCAIFLILGLVLVRQGFWWAWVSNRKKSLRDITTASKSLNYTPDEGFERTMFPGDGATDSVIAVGMVAYDPSECCSTIWSLFHTSSDPARIRVYVWDATNTSNDALAQRENGVPRSSGWNPARSLHERYRRDYPSRLGLRNYHDQIEVLVPRSEKPANINETAEERVCTRALADTSTVMYLALGDSCHLANNWDLRMLRLLDQATLLANITPTEAITKVVLTFEPAHEPDFRFWTPAGLVPQAPIGGATFSRVRALEPANWRLLGGDWEVLPTGDRLDSDLDLIVSVNLASRHLFFCHRQLIEETMGYPMFPRVSSGHLDATTLLLAGKSCLMFSVEGAPLACRIRRDIRRQPLLIGQTRAHTPRQFFEQTLSSDQVTIALQRYGISRNEQPRVDRRPRETTGLSRSFTSMESIEQKPPPSNLDNPRPLLTKSVYAHSHEGIREQQLMQ